MAAGPPLPPRLVDVHRALPALHTVEAGRAGEPGAVEVGPVEVCSLEARAGEFGHGEIGAGEHREVLETYRMFAHDAGWLRRIREAIETGLSAEAAVRRVQDETRLRIGHASDPYLRERLLDLDDIANRLLLHLTGRAKTHDPALLPNDVVLIARNLSAAELIEYDRAKIRGALDKSG